MIFAYCCGMLDHAFTDRDEEQINRMCRNLDNPQNDMWEYKLEDGKAILFWRKDGRIHGNIFGHDERDIPESSIANGRRDEVRA